MKFKIILVTQARTSSTRLPGKVLMKIRGKPMINYHLERLSQARYVEKIIIATTNNKKDDGLVNHVESLGFEVYRGSENDVLDRFYQSVKHYFPDWVVRVTSDCPLIDPELIDKVIIKILNYGCDYGSNTLVEKFPDGQDIEVFKFSALKKAWKESILKSDREHVTSFIKNNSNFNGGNLFSALNYNIELDFSQTRMTVDEKEDLEVIKILIKNLGSNKTWLDYANYISLKGLNKINGMIIRNEGFYKSLKNDKNG